MASFLTELERLLEVATERGIVDRPTAAALRSVAGEHQEGRGIVSLAAVLGWLGGVASFAGATLLVAANWQEISDWTKLGGLLLFLGGAHGTGLWIRWSGRPYEKTAEALGFVGSGLFLAGIALIAQIYHLDERPPNGILLWAAAVCPLAAVLRSPALTLLSICAVLLWAHMEGSFRGSVVEMPRYSSTPHLVLEIGAGAALVGFSGLLRSIEPALAKVCRIAGSFILFAGLYLLGFYRHFSDVWDVGSVLLPAVFLGLGALGLASGGKELAQGHPQLRNRLIALLAAVIAVSALALAGESEAWPRGPRLVFFNFGAEQAFDAFAWGVSLGAWALWFLLALWCVAFGARSGRKAYLNAGAFGVGIGIVTLFFDLIGTLATTGGIFLLGGVVLLATAWAVEKWRRSIVVRMGGESR